MLENTRKIRVNGRADLVTETRALSRAMTFGHWFGAVVGKHQKVDVYSLTHT